MLRHLSIRNYALIENIEMELREKLTVITGETGSGKSIILGALGLIVGERADTKSLRNPDKKCIVEAQFGIDSFGLKSFFEHHDLDFEALTVVRREIAPSGKSRAFINDTPVKLNVLKAFGKQLVDIHSQHQNSILYEEEFQLGIADAFADNDQILRDYQAQYSTFKNIKKKLNELKNRQSQSMQDQDFMAFQLTELDEANLEAIDRESLEEELETLTHAEEIKSAFARAFSLLDEQEFSAVTSVKDASQAIEGISHLGKSYSAMAERLRSSLIEIQDIAAELEQTADQVEFDEERIKILNDQLNTVNTLEQKHRAAGLTELIELREDIRKKLDSTANLESDIEQAENDLKKQESLLSEIAKTLTGRRSESLPKVKKEVEELLSFVGMPHAELDPRIEEKENFDALGKDKLTFLFKTNKGHQFQPIEKIASGGETSRVMLALKASISKHKALPVLILDEIDAGVSGEIASKMGKVMKDMSANMQLITITHLPQIASQGDNHYKVHKETKGETTSTYLSELTREQRIGEIAQMLSGEKTTDAAINNARELMGEL